MREISNFLISAWALCGILPSVDAGIGHNVGTTPDQAYLDYGDFFPSVGWLFAQDNGVDAAFGSGVLIDEHWVLTAAHLVLAVDSVPSSAYNGFDFGVGANLFSDPGESHLGFESFINPGYAGVGVGPDLALIYFADPFASVAPATLFMGSNSIGIPNSLVGFGVTGTPATGLLGVDGNRRAGVNLLTDLDIPTGYMRARFLSPAEAGFQQLGILGTPGDSGGGWFIDEDGEMQLAGISSFWGGFPNYGGRTSATHLTPETLAWIDTTIQSKTAIPEPSAFLIFTMLAGISYALRGVKQCFI